MDIVDYSLTYKLKVGAQARSLELATDHMKCVHPKNNAKAD